MKNTQNIDELLKRLKSLEEENKLLKTKLDMESGNPTVHVPKEFSKLFEKAEKVVDSYFNEFSRKASSGEIVISGERYILLRSASLSYEFMDVLKEFYSNHSTEEATRIGNNFLYDIAHVIGKEDAIAFQKKMKLTDPVEKLSAGPVHFAYTGWANVEILKESNPSPDDNFFLKYRHHNSFEAQSWIKAKRKSKIPVCTMNGGYSSGWCEESFGRPLTAVEVACEAHGAEHCTFIMAPPHRIQEYLEKEVTSQKLEKYNVPVFFERKYNEDRLQDSLQQKETLLKEVHHRVKNNLQVISSLLNLQKGGVQDANLKKSFDSIIGRVQTMAHVQDMIYSSKDLNSINIEDYFKQLINALYQIYKVPESELEFDVKIDVKDNNLDPEIAIPLGLIINEIACNSFKYAFSEGGLFYLKLNQKEGHYHLMIGDNGKGIQNGENEESLGMSLIEILCEQIDAELKVNNSSDGLEYNIKLSANQAK
ncbi:MAG: hypothetical protein BM555_04380 [Crocinitomix sp. MedPE-SWsnd]|nr:MAG: hypothetical protein BM555_04380 [Crocinitomix sp. MedPE-SWsnd]